MSAPAISLLLELQALDRVPRAGYALRGVQVPESVSEHAFHVALVVLLLGRTEADLDLSRALQMALLHDIAEVRIGDLPQPTNRYFPAGAKAEAESRALEDLLTAVDEDALEIAKEYEARASLEARFVKACDRFQLLLKASRYEADGQRGVREFFREGGSFDDGGFESLRAAWQALVAWRLEEGLSHSRNLEDGP